MSKLSNFLSPWGPLGNMAGSQRESYGVWKPCILYQESITKADCPLPLLGAEWRGDALVFGY